MLNEKLTLATLRLLKKFYLSLTTYIETIISEEMINANNMIDINSFNKSITCLYINFK
jgi:hypothetical protein